MAKFIEVTIEWNRWTEIVTVELPDDATDEDAAQGARDAFFNVCNYGWEWVTKSNG